MDDLHWKQYNEYAGVSAWAVDFLRAFKERPRIFRPILRILVGKYAWRELCGMAESLRETGMMPEFGYDLEGCEYHKTSDVLYRENAE